MNDQSTVSVIGSAILKIVINQTTLFQSENIAYCLGGGKTRDSYDTIVGVGSELAYDTMGV